MTPIVRARLTAVVVFAALVVCAFGLWKPARNPLGNLPPVPGPEQQSGTVKESIRATLPPRPSDAYAGSTVCAECHADICRDYARHPMGMSLSAIDAAEAVEDYSQNAHFDAPPSPSSDLTFQYSVRRDAEGVQHHETAVDPKGNVVYDQGEVVHYAVGSGRRGRSYISNRDGLLFMSPITWYSQKSRWNLSPGYNVFNLRFERRILDGCIACHAGRMDVVPERPNCFRPSPFLEAAIGCERCHGPAQEHVAWQRSGVDEGGPDPIVNPARLDRRERDSVCFQCHLVGEARIARYGRSDFDFRPGDDLSDVWTVFVLGTGVTDDRTTSAVSQPEQMLSSACYRKSAGELSCTSCHDPHSVPKPEDRVGYYRSRCLECHSARAGQCSMPESQRREATADDSCVRCHMPRIDANDVPHTSQTDHRVLRSYDASTVGGFGDSPKFNVFGEDAGRVSEVELERARGIVMVMEAERRKDARLAYEAIPKLQSWFDAAPDDAPAAEALGVAYSMNHDATAAEETWERALAFHSGNEQLLKRLTILMNDNGHYSEGLEYARRLVAVNPWQHEYHGRMAHMLGHLGRFDEAIAAAETALRINPIAIGVHGWLAEVYAQRGDRERSRYHQRQFETLSLRR